MRNQQNLSSHMGPGRNPSLLQEETLGALEMRIRKRLDTATRLEQIRFRSEDDQGIMIETKLELSAATIALRFETLSDDVKEVLIGSERARMLAAKAFEVIHRLASIGARANQARLMRVLGEIEKDGEISEIARLHAGVEAIKSEYENNNLQRVRTLRQKIEQATILTTDVIPYLDAVQTYCMTLRRLLGAMWVSEFSEGAERDGAKTAGSPTQRRLVRGILRTIKTSVGRVRPTFLTDAIAMEQLANNITGNLSTANAGDLLEKLYARASETIDRLALTSYETTHMAMISL